MKEKTKERMKKTKVNKNEIKIEKTKERIMI